MECEFCLNHEQGDTLYEPSDWDGGIGFDYIRDIQYCPVCGRKLAEQTEPNISCSTCGYSQQTPSCDTCEGYSNWYALDTCDECIFVKGSRWCDNCNGKPKGLDALPNSRKAEQTEPNCSEKPNNCEHITEDGVTCAKYPACDDCLDNPLNKVKGSERLLKGKDEPQTERSE